MKDPDAEIVIQLKKKLKDQTVKTQDKTIWPDIVNDLKLLQSRFQHFQFCSFYGIFCMMIPDKHKLLNIRNIFFHEIHRNLENDRFIWNCAFGGMNYIDIDQDAVSRVDGKAGIFYGDIKSAFLHIKDLNSPVPVRRNVASVVCRSVKFNVGDTRIIYDLIGNFFFIHKTLLQKENIDLYIGAFLT